MTDHSSGVSILLSKLQRQIGHGLRYTLHRHCLIVREPVVLRKKVVFHKKQSRSLISQNYNMRVTSIHTCVSTLALSIRVLASAIKPLMAQPSKQKDHDVRRSGAAHSAA